MTSRHCLHCGLMQALPCFPVKSPRVKVQGRLVSLAGLANFRTPDYRNHRVSPAVTPNRACPPHTRRKIGHSESPPDVISLLIPPPDVIALVTRDIVAQSHNEHGASASYSNPLAFFTPLHYCFLKYPFPLTIQTIRKNIPRPQFFRSPSNWTAQNNHLPTIPIQSIFSSGTCKV